MAITTNSRRTGTPKRPQALDFVPPPRSGATALENPRSVYTGIPAVGQPLQEIAVVQSMGGVLEYTLPPTDISASEHTVPSQIVRVSCGDRVRLRAESPSATGPGQQHTYTVPADHPAGLHWPHPRFHASSTRRSWLGLPGVVVVEGDIDQVPGIAGARDRIMILRGSTYEAAGATAPPPPPPPADGTHRLAPRPSMPTALTATVNGQVLPDIDIQPGEIQRWRILNAEPHREMWLHVEGHTLHQIGQDGIPFTHTRPAQSIMLSPGNRAELLIRATKPGRYRVYAEAYNTRHPGSAQPTALLATMTVEGRPVFNRLPRQLVESPAFPAGPIMTRRTLRVGTTPSEHDTGTPRIVIDGRHVEKNRLGTLATAGTVEEWTFVNDDDVQHPIHVQGNPFQVVDVQGIPAGDPSWQTDSEIWWDTYRLPPGGQVTIRTYFLPESTNTR
ncbi:multicopper oxidase family protein [Phytoactinopolyspora mesophila]|uniref:Multicopper oxidase domain-containing protein n=1 Tax=Phytoactinopolyspora mesophila TaxID=2650750 RepID=A0A7K3M7S8_9ACTN|nr:multicopper oxidase domain-containing protein [Phytoactinopolyspora mesophila]NDL59107.1 multicopper oxidase domain-containing protein [Phytoactinopolyspora mesophila]